MATLPWTARCVWLLLASMLMIACDERPRPAPSVGGGSAKPSTDAVGLPEGWRLFDRGDPDKQVMRAIHVLDVSEAAGLVVGGGDGAVYVWDYRSGKLRNTIGAGVGDVWAAAFSHDGNRLAFAGESGEVTVVDAASAVTLATFRPMPGAIGALAFSPDDTVLALTSFRSVVLWDMIGSRLMRRVESWPEDQIGAYWDVAFTSDGKALLAAGNDLLQKIDVESGQLLGDLPAVPTESIQHLALAGDMLVVAQQQAWSVWNLADGRMVAHIAADPGTSVNSHAIAVSRDGAMAAFASRQLTVISTRSAQVVHREVLPEMEATAMCFSPNGSEILVAVAPNVFSSMLVEIPVSSVHRLKQTDPEGSPTTEPSGPR